MVIGDEAAVEGTRQRRQSRESIVGCCAPLDLVDLSPADAAATAALFKALGDPARVRLLNLIATASGPVCQCDLTAPLGLTQGTVSHHLRKLVAAGLLMREQRGIWAYYTVNTETT